MAQQMTMVINGDTYYYVGTTYDDDLIYDIYENEQDQEERVYIPVGSMY